MDIEVIKKMRKEYNDWVMEKFHIKMLINKINRLKNHPAVIEYLQSVEKLEEIDYERILNTTEEEKIFSIFNANKQLIENTNKIYLYFGTYRFPMYGEYDVERGPCDIRLTREDPNAEFRIYFDIESSKPLQIAIDKCEDFEKENKVIIPKSPFVGMADLYNIQKEFIITAVKQDEEQAVEKVLSKNK